MHILSAKEIREWDQYTIQQEPISSIDLMERAATSCANWIATNYPEKWNFSVYCGPGNNGGDGLVVARILHQRGYAISVCILSSERYSNDHQVNLARLQQAGIHEIRFLHAEKDLPTHHDREIIIDALFGTGLNAPLQGMAATVVKHINQANCPVISIDLPSGLFADESSGKNIVVHARYTLSFHCFKRALLMQENALAIGNVEILDIGLHPGYLSGIDNKATVINQTYCKSIFRKRNRFAHKGKFGHALLVAGSYGKMGAAILSARACLHSGTGLLTCYLPRCGYGIMQGAVPEAMVLTDWNEHHLSNLPDAIENYSAIGIGPGIGTADETQTLVSFLVRRYRKPLVVDADGLNCLSLQKELIAHLPVHSILTPHPKEFDRLFGEHANDFDRAATAYRKAVELKLVIVLKSHHTLVAAPDGREFYNTTGNAGMAKGGSGDVLTGMITALLAQQYPPFHAAILGVYLHGLAGDIALQNTSLEGMTASNLLEAIPSAFSELY